MKFRKKLSFLSLAIGLVFAPPAAAQPKSVGPSNAGPRPNAVRPYIASAALPGRRCCSGGLRPPHGGGDTAATECLRSGEFTSPCSHCENWSYGGVKPPLRHADPSASSGQALPASATPQGISPAMPFTQEQVASMVCAGLGDDSGAKLSNKRQFRALAISLRYNGH